MAGEERTIIEVVMQEDSLEKLISSLQETSIEIDYDNLYGENIRKMRYTGQDLLDD